MRSLVVSHNRYVNRTLRNFAKLATVLPLIAAGADDDVEPPPDHWAIVQAYLDANDAHWKQHMEILRAEIAEEEKERRRQELGPGPDESAAAAAATAIIESGGEQTLEAVDFLLNRPMRSVSETTLEDPVARATARYFAASHLIQSANLQSLPQAERTAHEKQALALATGLSDGIADEVFILKRQDTDGAERPMTFADAEGELLYSLRSTTVGGFVSDVTAPRLDGTADSLSNYAGQVVLVDFWATWCGPCIAAFPKLREMTAELPEGHFQIVGINVDAELETAEDYLDDNPLPWVVWHVGDESEIVRKWRVTGFPTYVLIGPEGRILARNAGTFDEDFRSTVEQAVSGLSEPAAATP